MFPTFFFHFWDCLALLPLQPDTWPERNRRWCRASRQSGEASQPSHQSHRTDELGLQLGVSTLVITSGNLMGI